MADEPVFETAKAQESRMLPYPCPECGAGMVLKNSKFGPFYGCVRFPLCKGSHGAHPDGTPLGVPADAETKKARIKAHAAFDYLWQTRIMKRKEAYSWMQRAMNLEEEDAHIGKFNKEQCSRLIELVQQRLAPIK